MQNQQEITTEMQAEPEIQDNNSILEQIVRVMNDSFTKRDNEFDIQMERQSKLNENLIEDIVTLKDKQQTALEQTENNSQAMFVLNLQMKGQSEINKKLEEYIADIKNMQRGLQEVQQTKSVEANKELQIKKLNMLRTLGELAQTGVKLSQNYSMESDYETMKFEYELLTNLKKEKKMIEHEKKITDVLKDYTTIQEKQKETSDQLANAEHLLNYLCTDLKNQHAGFTSALNVHAKHLDKELERRDTMIDHIDTDVQKLFDNQDNMDAKIDVLSSDLQDMYENQGSQDIQLSMLRSNVKTVESTINTIEDKIDSVSADADIMAEKFLKTSTKLHELASTVVAVNIACKEKNAKIDELTITVADLTNRLDNLSNLKADTDYELQMRDDKIGELTKTVTDLNAKFVSLTEIVNKLNKPPGLDKTTGYASYGDVFDIPMLYIPSTGTNTDIFKEQKSKITDWFSVDNTPVNQNNTPPGLINIYRPTEGPTTSTTLNNNSAWDNTTWANTTWESVVKVDKNDIEKVPPIPKYSVSPWGKFLIRTTDSGTIKDLKGFVSPATTGTATTGTATTGTATTGTATTGTATTGTAKPKVIEVTPTEKKVKIEKSRMNRAQTDNIQIKSMEMTGPIVTCKVVGTTGNTYVVDFPGHPGMTKTPRCTCPDYTLNGYRCKHIYYVLNSLYVDNPYKETFLRSELDKYVIGTQFTKFGKK